MNKELIEKCNVLAQRVETLESESLNIDAIKPKEEGSKYSPNLYAWLKARFRPEQIKVLADVDGTLMIGHVDNDHGDGPWLHGTRLMSVLFDGIKAKSMAYPIGSRFPFKEQPHFWVHYTEDGRCAIDPKHERYFVGDQHRWEIVGDTRRCRWCGKRHERLETWTETIKRTAWKPVTESTEAGDCK